MPATPRRPASGPCRLLTALLLAHLLAILALAACPAWHHWLHADADGDDDHQCAVTLFLNGGADAPALPVAAAPAPAASGSSLGPSVRPVAWVASLFAAARIFEHGPPSLR